MKRIHTRTLAHTHTRMHAYQCTVIFSQSITDFPYDIRCSHCICISVLASFQRKLLKNKYKQTILTEMFVSSAESESTYARITYTYVFAHRTAVSNGEQQPLGS